MIMVFRPGVSSDTRKEERRMPKLAFGVFSLIVLCLAGGCLTGQGMSPGISSLTPPDSGKEAPDSLLKQDVDLSKVVLNTKDLAGLFPPTYALRQKIDTAEAKGLIVTYQTESIAHTLAFAKGFATRIEIYENEETARAFFLKRTSAETGAPLALNPIGDESRASRSNIGTPEGFEVPGNQYSLVFRHRNALVAILVRINQVLPPHRVEALGTLVLNRLQGLHP
jgi:hypothetical protein